MDKKQVIALIERQLAEGRITRDDLRALADHAQNSSPADISTSVDARAIPDRQEMSRNLINILYSVGAIIVLAGVAILTAQHWQEIGFPGRIAITLGISVVAYIVAMILNQPEQRIISSVLFTMSAALAPLGAYVLLDQASMAYTWSTQLTIACILAVIFGTALYVSKRNILTLLTIAFATWAYYSLIMKMFSYDAGASDMLKWATLLLGAAYVFLAYGLQARMGSSDRASLHEKKAIQNILYGLGTIAILGVALSFDGIFDVVTIALIFAGFYGSVFLKSRSMLILSALFLIGYLFKLTSKYFIDSLGWPVALIAVGLLVIAIGYFTLYLNKKYMTK